MLARGLQNLGSNFLDACTDLGRSGIFLYEIFISLLRPPYRVSPAIRQLHFVGARSTMVISVAGAFVGMVVALQFYNTLVRFGSVGLLGAAVGLSLIRELGPVLTALMIIGRAGSAMCAEIGIMRTDEQIDALECMSVDPLKYLMVPRAIATVIAVPILTALFIVIGIFGGWFVGVVLYGVSQGTYFGGMYDSVEMADVSMGLMKSLAFGVLIVWISTSKGYFLHLDRKGAFGAEGVSRVTTDAVVLSSMAVLAADYLITALVMP